MSQVTFVPKYPVLVRRTIVIAVVIGLSGILAGVIAKPPQLVIIVLGCFFLVAAVAVYALQVTMVTFLADQTIVTRRVGRRLIPNVEITGFGPTGIEVKGSMFQLGPFENQADFMAMAAQIRHSTLTGVSNPPSQSRRFDDREATNIVLAGMVISYAVTWVFARLGWLDWVGAPNIPTVQSGVVVITIVVVGLVAVRLRRS